MSGFHPTDLIREVKSRPPIYNRDLLEIPRREHKHQLWLEVAENLTHPEDWEQYTDVEKDARIDEIQCKWKHLKDHFHREIKVIESGQAHKKRKYVYFDDMEFMRPFVGFKLPPMHKRIAKQETVEFLDEPLDNVAGSDMESFLITNEITEDESEATPSKRARHSIKSTPTVMQKQTSTHVRKGQKDGGIKHFEFLRKSSISKETGPNPTFKIRDGDISFCLSLVPNLRKMDDSKKLLAKIEILKVLHKYIDSIERSNFPNSSTKAQNHNNHTQIVVENYDDPDMQEDHLDEFEEGGGGISIVKYEEYVDPLNGSGNTKTWWT